jgi:hypothetical protein
MIAQTSSSPVPWLTMQARHALDRRGGEQYLTLVRRHIASAIGRSMR